MNAFDLELGEEINNRKVSYPLHFKLWEKFDYSTIDLSFQTWEKIKYLNKDGSNFSNEIKEIPNDQGGLYLFFLKCPIITGITEFPLYIGRCQLTQGQNLRKRVKEYFQHYSKNTERPMIYKMISYWGPKLYVAFKPLEENDTIVNIERDITNFLLLPMNDLIPEKKIRDAVKAF